MQKIDPRYFSKNAYEGLGEVRETIAPPITVKLAQSFKDFPLILPLGVYTDWQVMQLSMLIVADQRIRVTRDLFIEPFLKN